MTLPARTPLPSLLPESAPFTPEQRTWLNGFFAGLISLELDGTPLSAAAVAELVPATSEGRAPAPTADEDDTPWHDQTLALAERMKLAEGRPLQQRLMAAMAQQDCGQCGYLCKSYAEAIHSGAEPRLNLCVPGGKETTRMLGTLKSATQPLVVVLSESAPPKPAPIAGTREHPLPATLVARQRLNKPGSEKETWHVELDTAGETIAYEVGDSLGVYPKNDPALVNAVIAALNVPADFPIGGRTLRDELFDAVSLGPAPDMLFQLFSYISGGDKRQKAKALAAGENPDGDAATLDVLAALRKFPGVRPDPEAFVESLDALRPRLYSIASSPKLAGTRVALTVDAVRYKIADRMRLGVASTFFADRMPLGERIKVYVQKPHGFALPKDPSVPIVMIGPGTGVAPFRAFLQERMAIKAPGKNWLFFGHQHRMHDFFYEDEFGNLRSAGVLSRLSLAWSRDDVEKFYVQDRMRQAGADLWSWLGEGAHLYVCGGIRMGQDVERTLVDIVVQHGGRSTAEAVSFVAGLKKAGRYQADVY
jgi:sulfite reductase (NADPH) flavoprotein alpha-component